MFAQKLIAIAFLGLSLSLGACGQETIEWPDSPAGGCGSYYPGGGNDTDSAGGPNYTFRNEGATAPCAVWESARKDEHGADPNTYINMGELYLQASRAANEPDIGDILENQWGIREPTYMVFVMSAEECSACKDLIRGPGDQVGIAELKDDYDAAGALMIGVCRYHFTQETPPFNLEDADAVLVEDDGWPTDWHRINDAENLLGLLPGVGEKSQNYPQAIVVRLSDMQVTLYHPEGSDAQLLLDAVSGE